MKAWFAKRKRFSPGRGRREIPEDIWIKCPKCGELSYRKEFEAALQVCQKCGYHHPLSARERIALLLDPGSFQELAADLEPDDPLGFADASGSYVDKLARTQVKTGLKEAVLAGEGTLEGLPLVVAVADFAFLGASMGSVYGEKIARAAERARERRVPLLTVNASGGARMHEGVVSLFQMAKTTAALVELARAGVPHFALLVDPCYGGVTASYASLADVILAEPGARIGFAGRRVIEQVTRQKLPPDFQTAEFLLEHGMIDLVVPRRELRSTLARLLRLHGGAPREEGGG